MIRHCHVDLIVEIARGLRSVGRLRSYAELGTASGKCFNAVAPLVAGPAHAVDIDASCLDPIAGNHNLHWHHLTTQEFLRRAAVNGAAPFDLVFIDADHRHAESLADFEAAFPLVTDGGLMLLHDVYPEDTSQISAAGRRSGTTYQTAEVIRRDWRDRCEIVTLPFYSGVAIVRKTDRQLSWRARP